MNDIFEPVRPYVIRWIDDYTLNMVPLLRNRNVVGNYAQQWYGNKLRLSAGPGKKKSIDVKSRTSQIDKFDVWYVVSAQGLIVAISKSSHCRVATIVATIELENARAA